jgi:arginase family enzyme
LIREGWIWPQHLSLIGVADYPGPNPGNGAEGLYRDSYLGGGNVGVSFFPLQNFRRRYKSALTDFLRGAIKTHYVYVSLDLDVASYRGVLAARYMDLPGISARIVLEVARQIRAACQEKGVELVGLDVMEFNQHFLGLRTEDGLRDQTLPLVRQFMRIILS